MNEPYDAIIVGSGAAGGIVAAVLAEAGQRVLLLERGRRLSYETVGRDHLRNHRLALYGHNTGPDLNGNPRVAVDPRGAVHVVRPNESAYQNNAVCVGGGTLVFGAQAWRFMESDFRMAGTYGVPEGSSLADWPIAYGDLELCYQRAEWEMGVAGDGSANRFAAPRQRPYPMAPVPDNPEHHILRAGAEKLGWNTFTPPLLINTKPYNGRPACVQCLSCVGFACPSDSKNGTADTMIPRALSTGRCELVTEAMVERIDTDAAGRPIGVSYFVDRNGTPERITARAGVVISSCGAIESARLLINSPSDREPHGLGNNHDLVGRNLQGHYYPGALGTLPQRMFDGLGPGPSIATCQFNHNNSGIIGGGMLANEFTKLPIIFWRGALPPEVPRWGLECKRYMRENYTRSVHIQGPVQEIPSPDARITVDPAVRDRWGIPVARLSGTTHPQTVRTAEFMRDRAQEWLHASGATRVWSHPVGLWLSAGQHQAGTCRMGNDPRASVTDSFGLVHGHDNLFVVDASLHVTNGGFNPVLTIMALAFRCAEHISGRL